MHLTSPDSRGLFDKAIIQSGAFALNQDSHAQAEAAGQAVAEQLGLPNATAEQLRSVPVEQLVEKFPFATIPGYIDGKVVQRSVAESFAAGEFAQVPILQGTNHEEEAAFIAAGLAVARAASCSRERSPRRTTSRRSQPFWEFRQSVRDRSQTSTHWSRSSPRLEH